MGMASLHDRIEDLEHKRELLDQKIRRELRRPLPNVDLLREFKISKLRLKEEIFKLLSK
jgi:hypothetical protein